MFGIHGEVTQVKVLPKRRFAYIGYHSAKAAAAARKYMHETYIDTSKVEVMDALAYGDDSLPRPWSRYSAGSSAFAGAAAARGVGAELAPATERRKREKKIESDIRATEAAAAETRIKQERDVLQKVYALREGKADDPELAEFWSVAGDGSSRKRTWANDDDGGAVLPGAVAAAAAQKATATFSKVEGKMYGSRGLPMVQSHVTFESDDEYQDISGSSPGASAVDEAKSVEPGDSAQPSAAADESLSDMDYLRSKMPAGGTEDAQSNSPDTQEPPVAPKRKRKKSGRKDGASTDSKAGGTEPRGEGKSQLKAEAASSKAAVAAAMASGSDKITVRLRGLPFKATENDIEDFFQPIEVLDVRLTRDRKNRPSGRGFVDIAPHDLAHALKFNNASMDDRYIEVSLDEPDEQDDRNSRRKPEPVVKPPHKFADKQVDPSLILETGRLFVRNLSYMCTEDELEALMTPFGPLSEVLIPIDRETKKSKAIAFITFLMPEHAVEAYRALDGQPFQGRLLHLIPAEDKRDHSGVVTDGTDSTTNYKKKVAAKRKAESGSAYNWNALFMRSDTVAGAMAAEYGVDKADILDKDADGSMAVRMALGETHIVAENKRFLEENGVKLDAFDTRVTGRSKTVILVKNTPFEATADEIRSIFAKLGEVSRVVFPPSKTMALVEMPIPQEARAAFRALAYRKFKHVPLYLEWAPEGCLSERPPASSGNMTATTTTSTLKTSDVDADADPTTDDTQAVSTLFVKNLNFGTGEDALRVHFERVVALRSVRVVTKKNVKDPNTPLSMGFGFVDFATKEDAMTALKALQHSELDGHKLELKFSVKREDASGEAQGRVVKVGGTKLLIRNLPFEATKKELRELCQVFGQIKSVRIPKKFDGAHRGFAFVDFLSKKEAKTAFEALSLSTHLYGRKLVVEWAQDDASLEALQSKTRADFTASKRPASKKARIDFD